MKYILVIVLFALVGCKDPDYRIEAKIKVTFVNGDTEVINFSSTRSGKPWGGNPFYLYNSCLLYSQSNNSSALQMRCGVRDFKLQSYNHYEIK
jgi:hypothetical protein